jgi:hypothetical protein
MWDEVGCNLRNVITVVGKTATKEESFAAVNHYHTFLQYASKVRNGTYISIHNNGSNCKLIHQEKMLTLAKKTKTTTSHLKQCKVELTPS